MPRTPSNIPVGTGFTPDLFDLAAFLKELVDNDGNKGAMLDGIWRPSVRIKATKSAPLRRMRSLPLEAAVQYGLLTPGSYRVTEVTRNLRTFSDPKVYEEFARHILLDLGGLRVIEAAQQMKLDGLAITGDTLARYLTNQGFRVTEHNTAINSLRMWLAKVGIFSGKGWEVDLIRKLQILGIDDDTIAALVSLTEEQRAFLTALCRIDPLGPYPAAEVRNLAESILGRTVARASLPQVILEPLRQAGLIDYQTRGTKGGKTSTVETTPKFHSDVLAPFIERTAATLDAALTAYYRRPPAQIYTELESASINLKGQALEAYAVHIMRLMGLRFVGWRQRARDTTGRAEIDVIMAGSVGGLPTRWQVQCKNTPRGRVALEDVAKEVGLLPLTKATHILVLANCRFTSDAVTYAREIMKHSAVIIFLLDVKDFDLIRKSPGDLPLILRGKAEDITRLHPDKTMWGF